MASDLLIEKRKNNEMNIEQFNKEVTESLADICKHLGDFQLFIEVFRLKQLPLVEEEITQFFKEGLNERKAYDIEYEYSGPLKTEEEILNAIEEWFNIARLGIIKGTKIIDLTKHFLSNLEKLLSYFKVNKCTYKKKGINGRVEYSLDYDYFFVRNNSMSLVFEVGGDD